VRLRRTYEKLIFKSSMIREFAGYFLMAGTAETLGVLSQKVLE